MTLQINGKFQWDIGTGGPSAVSIRIERRRREVDHAPRVQRLLSITKKFSLEVTWPLKKYFYSPEPKHSFERIMETVDGAKNGVDKFGYYSIKSERI